MIGAAPVPLADTSPFRARIDNAPLAANSAAIAANLKSQIDPYWNGIAGFNSHSYNNSYYVADANTPRRTMGFSNCNGLTYVPNHLLSGNGYFLNVPIPVGAKPAEASDRALSIYDPVQDKLWEFWNVNVLANGEYAACWGGRIDNVSKSSGVFNAPYGMTATGLSMTAGMISIEELKAGRIDHAMYLAVRDAQVRTNLSWPAVRGDGLSTDPNVVRQGQRLRLDPTINLDNYQLTRVGRMVAEAAQKYGFIVSDKGGAVTVVTEAGLATQDATGVNPWDAVQTEAKYAVMRNFPWGSIQALPVDYGKP